MQALRSPTRLALAATLVVAALASACEDDYSEQILGFDAEGTVRVIVFRDDNLNNTFTASTDPLIERARVILRRTSTLADSVGRFTDTIGLAPFNSVPVGRYRIELYPDILGDSLERFDASPEFTVSRFDTVRISVGLRFFRFPVTEARALPLGRKVFVVGTVLNGPGTFGDSTVHLTDGRSFIRMSRVPQVGTNPGDSVAMLGTRTVRDGQPSFEVVRVVELADLDPPTPLTVTSAAIPSANSGQLDAAFVRVSAVTIADTVTTVDGKVLGIDDGSGRAVVLLSDFINFGRLDVYRPGVRLDVTGMLVPDPVTPGVWFLKPRNRSDVVILP
jgi:hypothetical protein